MYVINDLGEAGKGLGTADFSYGFGNPGDRPFVGYFDGDGIDSVGLYRESSGFVYFRNALSSGIADFEFFFGDPSDMIMAGDWTGKGFDTVAVYRRSDRRIYLRYTNTAGVADYQLDVDGWFEHAMRRAAGI